MSNKLLGGKGDKLNPKNVDSHELKKGIKHEMEHTKDPKIAKEIALDHLSENPKYYTELNKAGIDEIRRMQKLAGINELEINNPRINISAEFEEHDEEGEYIIYFINIPELDDDFMGYYEYYEYSNKDNIRIIYDPEVHNDPEVRIYEIINSPKYKYITSKKMNDDTIYIYIPLDKIKFKPGESPEEVIND